jgi:phosphodiesterase/alkaline phosphatase D-like protein
MYGQPPHLISAEVLLDNLSPSTIYFYQVGDAQDGWSDVFSFETESLVPPTPAAPLNILVTADQGATNWSAANVAAMLQQDAERDYRLVLFSGDISYANLDSKTWDLWEEMIQPLAAIVPMM